MLYLQFYHQENHDDKDITVIQYKKLSMKIYGRIEMDEVLRTLVKWEVSNNILALYFPTWPHMHGKWHWMRNFHPFPLRTAQLATFKQ